MTYNREWRLNSPPGESSLIITFPGGEPLSALTMNAVTKRVAGSAIQAAVIVPDIATFIDLADDAKLWEEKAIQVHGLVRDYNLDFTQEHVRNAAGYKSRILIGGVVFRWQWFATKGQIHVLPRPSFNLTIGEFRKVVLTVAEFTRTRDLGVLGLL